MARPTQALAGLSALLTGHFAAFLSLTPGPSPFSSTKITPADSRAARMAAIAFFETARRLRSKSTTVDRPNPADSASFPWSQSSNDRAALHWAGLISTFFVDV